MTRTKANAIAFSLFLIPASIIIAMMLVGEPQSHQCYIESSPGIAIGASPTPGLTPPASSIHCVAP